jgi:hypothetical protein
MTRMKHGFFVVVRVSSVFIRGFFSLVLLCPFYPERSFSGLCGHNLPDFPTFFALRPWNFRISSL